MTRADIIRMAREAGFRDPNPHDGCMGLAFDFRDGPDTGASLGLFANLVAAKAVADEREACARICDERANGWEMAAPARGDTEACMHHAAKNEARALGEAIRTGGVK